MVFWFLFISADADVFSHRWLWWIFKYVKLETRFREILMQNLFNIMKMQFFVENMGKL